jgi:hypothetical protein
MNILLKVVAIVSQVFGPLFVEWGARFVGPWMLTRATVSDTVSALRRALGSCLLV